tara:strand:+ start:1934 stop:3166 length:1233 start_codon:yes stop_codon:yes gene_type:complete
MKLPIKISIFLLFTVSLAYGQMSHYAYKRELRGVSDQWHKVVLPDGVFGKTSQDLGDIRIFGITAGKDTLEAPYLLRVAEEKITNRKVAFKTLNTSYNNNGHYFTFEIPSQKPTNQIDLEFKQQNFDWQVKLEGSQDLEEWFTVLEKYRILSIKNGTTNFQFTKLAFPNSQYRYYRLRIDSSERPELTVAGLLEQEVTEGTYKRHKIKHINTTENKESKQTEIEIELQAPVRASHIRVEVSDSFDHYRPVTLKYLTDSVETEKGWRYNYRHLTSGILNSMEDKGFQFGSTTVYKLKLLIHNGDNRPLKVDTIEVKGYVTELVARFTDPAHYFLTYGNEGATRPQYDIARFADQIPEALASVQVGKEIIMDKGEDAVTEPLFKNKRWLWAILLVIMAVLGWFTLKMIRQKE